VDACTTRLRLVVQDQALVREADLRALGAKGIVRPSARSLQVVLGPQADQVAQDIRRASAMAGQALSTRLAEAARQQSSGIPKAVLSSIGASNDTVIVVDGRIIIPSDCPVDLAALWANGLIAEKTIGPSRHLLFQRGSFAGGPET
jgi:PTS system N-acetylglucosamine-specific IIC component